MCNCVRRLCQSEGSLRTGRTLFYGSARVKLAWLVCGLCMGYIWVIHIYIYTYIYTYIYIYIHTFVGLYMGSNVYIYIHNRVYIHNYIYIYTWLIVSYSHPRMDRPIMYTSPYSWILTGYYLIEMNILNLLIDEDPEDPL